MSQPAAKKTVQPYTRVPNALFDGLLSNLSGAQLKTFMYLHRRTEGFHKLTDAVSLSQLAAGIRRADGTFLDNGTGLCRQSVISAIQDLESRHIIRVERSRTPYGDHDTNRYTINPDVYAAPHHYWSKKSEQPGEAAPAPRSASAVYPAGDESTSGPTFAVRPPVDSPAPGPTSAVHDESTSTEPPVRAPAPADDPMLRAMLDIGVAHPIAVELLRTFDAAAIAMQLAWLPHRRATNPAAMFTVALRKAWPAPEGWVRAQKRVAVDNERRESETAKTDRQRAEEERNFQLTVFIGLLGARQRDRLRTEATALLYEEAPLWRTKTIPPVMLEAYIRQVAEEWKATGVEPELSDDDLADMPGP